LTAAKRSEGTHRADCVVLSDVEIKGEMVISGGRGGTCNGFRTGDGRLVFYTFPTFIFDKVEGLNLRGEKSEGTFHR
jgi:hypothetical protein